MVKVTKEEKRNQKKTEDVTDSLQNKREEYQKQK